MEHKSRGLDSEKLERRKKMGKGETMTLEEIHSIIVKARTTPYKGLSGEAWAVLFSIFAAFGKRLNEIVKLRTSDIAVRGEDLAITFSILKKRGGNAPQRTKRLSLENPHAMRIVDYWETVKDPGGFMFPGARSPHINERYVHDMLYRELGLKHPVWSHLFRHSLATELAANNVGPFELKSWFDWENIATADAYVQAAGVSTRNISNRTW